MIQVFQYLLKHIEQSKNDTTNKEIYIVVTRAKLHVCRLALTKRVG